MSHIKRHAVSMSQTPGIKTTNSFFSKGWQAAVTNAKKNKEAALN